MFRPDLQKSQTPAPPIDKEMGQSEKQIFVLKNKK